jgi:hypothetical protein
MNRPNSGVNSTLQPCSVISQCQSGRNQPEPAKTTTKAKANRPARAKVRPTCRMARFSNVEPGSGPGSTCRTSTES